MKVALALFAAMTAMPTIDSNGSSGEVVYCGGETTQGELQAYFASLRDGLAADYQSSFFDRFVGDQFSVIRHDKRVVYNRAEFAAVTPRFLSRKDWSMIAMRGATGLRQAGWRGCFLDNGKVWFEAGERGLRLVTINHDLAWESGD